MCFVVLAKHFLVHFQRLRPCWKWMEKKFSINLMQKDRRYWQMWEKFHGNEEMSKLLDNNFQVLFSSYYDEKLRQEKNAAIISHRWMRIKNRFIILYCRQTRPEPDLAKLIFPRLSIPHFRVFLRVFWFHSIQKARNQDWKSLDIFHTTRRVRLLNGGKKRSERVWNFLFCFVFKSMTAHSYFNCVYANDEVS